MVRDLQRDGGGLVAEIEPWRSGDKTRQCVRERGAAETAHCWAWLAIVKVNDGSEVEVVASRLNSHI